MQTRDAIGGLEMPIDSGGDLASLHVQGRSQRAESHGRTFPPVRKKYKFAMIE